MHRKYMLLVISISDLRFFLVFQPHYTEITQGYQAFVDIIYYKKLANTSGIARYLWRITQQQ